jgi:tumor protein p53-inducible protein 3
MERTAPTERTMQAVLVKAPGGRDQLTLGRMPLPNLGDEDILVRVKATALNRADLLQREGKYPPPPGASPILGLEMAGLVAGRGRGAARWHVGEPVFGLLPGGGYAEYVAIHQDLAMPIPAVLSFEAAAAVPEAFLTAYQALYWIGRLAAGEHVLVHAGASGVGTAAIQLVRAAGAQAWVTASPAKHALCRALGAGAAIDYRTADFAAAVRDLTDGHGADVILDFVGAPYLERNVEALALDGRIVLLAMMGGSRLERFSLGPLFQKRGQLTASTLRNRSLDYKVRLSQAFLAYAAPRFADGTLRPVIDRVFDWADVAEAHQYMEENRNAGKVVLRIG